MNSAQDYLNQEYARRRGINSRYSQRAFARQLGLSPGELSELMSGKRKLSLKSALRIARTLGLTPTETKHLLHMSQLEKSRLLGAIELLEPTLTTPEAHNVSEDLFNLVSTWYCFAILNMVDTEGFRWDTHMIARRLGISRPEVQVAIERLERVGILRIENGQRKVVKDFVWNKGGIPSESVKTYHREMLDKAKHALDFQNIEERDVQGIGFAVDAKFLPSIKKDISDFLDTLIGKYSKGKRKHVYQIETALFRLTQGDTND